MHPVTEPALKEMMSLILKYYCKLQFVCIAWKQNNPK
jgi:hypothetical protein